jgi:hypothetical protein
VRTSDLIFGYFSPETLLPATSIVATIAGIVMILGRGSFRFIVRVSRRELRGAGRIARTSKRHFQLRDEARSQAPRL